MRVRDDVDMGPRIRLTRRGRTIARAVAATAVVGVAAAVILALRGPELVVPDDTCASPPPLVTSNGVTLQPLAMKAFKAADRMAEGRIEVVQSYRSCADQRMACERVCGNPDGCPNGCVAPGRSYHQLGAAIDISAASLEREGVKEALEEAGWCQSVPEGDPGHFSFGGCH